MEEITMSRNSLGRAAYVAAGWLLALTWMTAVPAAADDLLQEIKDRGYIRVGTFSIPPETWIDIDSGDWKGIDADFTKAIAEAIGVEVDPIVLQHSALAPALQSGRVDVIAGLYRTAEREQVMAYNEVPIWYGIDVLIAQKASDIGEFADMKGKILGVVRGSAQELEATKLQERFGVGEIRKYEQADPMLMDLKAGRLDGAIWWGFTFDYAAQQNPSYDFKVVEYLPPEYLDSETLPAVYYVFAKEGTDGLIKAFDDQISKMLEAGKSEEIMAKYGLTNPAYTTGRF
jgi:polar amino acid transport system substrate-binding protein